MILTPLKAKAMILSLLAAFIVGASLSLAVMKLRLDEQRSRHEVALKEKDRLYVQDMDALRYAHDIAATKVADEARVHQDAITTRYENALNDAQARQTALRTDLNRARAAASSLRDKITVANQTLVSSGYMPEGTNITPAQYALASSELLAECSAAYTELGEKADGHASDVRTLKEAWPQ